MKQFDFTRFWRKYGNLILGGLFLLFIINYCAQQPSTSNGSQSPVERIENGEQQQVEDNNGDLKSLEELIREKQQENSQRGPGSLFTVFLLLLLGVGIVWLARQKFVQDLKKKWFPGRVHFKVRRAKDKKTERRLIRISIENRTSEGLTFLPPMVVFKKGRNERRFRFKPGKQEDFFPLTLTPGTGHRVVLDLEQFYEKIPDLKKTSRVGASVETSDGKEYKDFALPIWLEVLIK